MNTNSRIFAKEQQVKLIDNILCSLCSVELTSEGRKYLKKMKQRILTEIVQLKYIESKQLVNEIVSPKGVDLSFENAGKTSW